MLYQKLLVGSHPYYLAVGYCDEFQLHRHPETELSFCLDGEYCVVIENTEYFLEKGDLVIIKPMEAHSYPDKFAPFSTRVTIELGPAFLGEHFSTFAKLGGILKLSSDGGQSFEKLRSLLNDIARLYKNRTELSDLRICADLYAISAELLEYFTCKGELLQSTTRLRDVEKIERSLEIIYQRYAQELDLDLVCRECGYSKSSFCRIFKKITGDTFHDLLNRHRVEIACMLLEESTDSVESIAQNTGFADSKSFCRVFHKIKNQSPGAYRKSKMTR